jgi:hypothetical protein
MAHHDTIRWFIDVMNQPSTRHGTPQGFENTVLYAIPV